MECLYDFLHIGFLIVVSDVERAFRRSIEADDPVQTREDRTYPRIEASDMTSGYIQFNRLFRGTHRRSHHQEQHKKNGREAKKLIAIHFLFPFPERILMLHMPCRHCLLKHDGNL